MKMFLLMSLLSFHSLLIDSINTNEMNGEMQFYMTEEEREIIHLSLTLHSQTKSSSGALICDSLNRLFIFTADTLTAQNASPAVPKQKAASQ